MDDPTLDASRHLQALQGLARINRWSGSVRIVWAPIRAFARESGARALRVLDIATGAGDVPIGLWHAAHRTGLLLEIDGCDRSPTALAHARSCAKHAKADIRFFELDALTGLIPSGYDIMISSLFLHHLDDEEAVFLLRNMGQTAGCMVLVNDLVRSVGGLTLAYVGTRFLSTSGVVRTDGLRSVRAAYSIDEVQKLARRTGFDGATVAPCWPSRFLLRWRRS